MTLSYADQPIIAQTTPIGSGAIAMLRLSGEGVCEIVDHHARLGGDKKLATVDSHTVHVGTMHDGDRLIDHVMFIVMRAPKTFTGEDVIEITCHNNQFIVEDIINVMLRRGVRLAQRGEFAQRAFMHGKIDLIQAESINDLIHASNQHILKHSLAQVRGSFSQELRAIEQQLLQVFMLSEASFEFLDDEIDFKEQIKPLVKNLRDRIQEMTRSSMQQGHIREGIRIALLGSVNAGKSSLFNALIKKERAIVTPVAGTTRDVIEAGVYTPDAYITYIDTAGIRQTDDIVEQEGIRRSLEEAQKADIIVLVVDAARTMTDQENSFYQKILNDYQKKTLLVFNKADQKIELPLLDYNEYYQVAAQTGFGIAALEQALHHRIQQLMDTGATSFLLNKRQHGLLVQVGQQLEEVDKLLYAPSLHYEILSLHIKDALAHVSELTGKTISEMGMDAIFREFCVGK